MYKCSKWPAFSASTSSVARKMVSLSATALAAFFTLLLTVLAAEKLYIDESCEAQADWKWWKDLALENIKDVIKRLDDPGDYDFEREVFFTFKIRRSDPRWKQIKKPLMAIDKWVEVVKGTQSRFEAIISAKHRTFCGDPTITEKDTKDPNEHINSAARFRRRRRPQPPVGGGTKRAAHNGHSIEKRSEGKWPYHPDDWTDILNYQYIGQNPKKLCESGVSGFSNMFNYPPAPADSPHSDQLEGRTASTICNFTFKKKQNDPKVPVLKNDFDFSNPQRFMWENVQWWNFNPARTLGHEWVHQAQPRIPIEDPRKPGTFIDDPNAPDGIGDIPAGKSYLFQNVKTLPFETAIINADSYAQLLDFAWLARHGLTLANERPWMNNIPANWNDFKAILAKERPWQEKYVPLPNNWNEFKGQLSYLASHGVMIYDPQTYGYVARAEDPCDEET
ncbi:hypothetical protein BDV95DRAFT_78149 [Massariosphaeria phaeospora]|uniref:Uncharacterized protein n=1 Tax=Massariosphaeria phaeospora TaxID=100035 RepID=A0A7C8M6X4_9PLEO|nr:hypothetical protein BDV95DRAFT_78149 [Massariosphaeria phaeospora]